MSDQKQPDNKGGGGIGGLPFGFGSSFHQTLTTPEPQTATTHALQSSSSPPPHLGPGGLPLSPSLIAVGSHPPAKHRHWGEKLWYETGTCYALGFFGGGAVGALAGLMKPIPTNDFKLRLNSVLNNAGRTSAQYGNSFAVFAMIYSMTRSTSRWYHRRRWTPVRPLPQVPYQRSDDKYEAFGVAVAGTVTAATRFTAGRSLACGAVLGMMMLGGLAMRHKYIDERGVKLTHL